MIRSLMIASAALAMSVPAFAEDAKAPAGDSAEVGKFQLAQVTAEAQARKHLLSQGYTNVSTLEQDAHGRWTGAAVKDGKTVIVGIHVPAAHPAAN
ncbi:MAG: hypothetical protein IKE66_04915 [Hyphomicrobium sp.]|nr:hypothetical protein [Hyphomicrobium sp.]